jgi:3-hydroxybutyrate dehydrogenase
LADHIVEQMTCRAISVTSASERPLADRVVLLTGAAGALGSAIRTHFEELGAAVVGADLHGSDCVHADIGTVEGNRLAIDTTVAAHGRLDILVLNAGVQHMAPLDAFPEERWRALLDVMVTGPFLAIRHAWPHLTARPGGRILVTASTSSFVGERFKAAYVTAKHGVLGLVKVAALEGAVHGLTANAVAPSWMRTPLVENQVADRVALLGLPEDEVIAGMVDEHAVGRFVEPSEVAATLAFLASPAASGITGACVPVDLGALA